jgi:hypothetical protein
LELCAAQGNIPSFEAKVENSHYLKKPSFEAYTSQRTPKPKKPNPSYLEKIAIFKYIKL